MSGYLTVFNSTRLERKLSVLLAIPLNGLDPDLQYYATKSGRRRVFRQAEVACPEGFEDLHADDDVLKALSELRRKRPGIRRAMVKLNESVSGEGNAVFTYPAERRPSDRSGRSLDVLRRVQEDGRRGGGVCGGSGEALTVGAAPHQPPW
jgi:hypothetical protein